MKHWYLQSFFQVSLSMLSGPHWLSGTPPPPHARGGYHMISTLINSMCISTYSRVQCKRSHKSFTKTKLRFHTLVDQELAFDKKGGYRRVKAAVKLTNGPWKFFPNAVVEFDAKIICLQDLASYYSVLWEEVIHWLHWYLSRCKWQLGAAGRLVHQFCPKLECGFSDSSWISRRDFHPPPCEGFSQRQKKRWHKVANPNRSRIAVESTL